MSTRHVWEVCNVIQVTDEVVTTETTPIVSEGRFLAGKSYTKQNGKFVLADYVSVSYQEEIRADEYPYVISGTNPTSDVLYKANGTTNNRRWYTGTDWVGDTIATTLRLADPFNY